MFSHQLDLGNARKRRTGSALILTEFDEVRKLRGEELNLLLRLSIRRNDGGLRSCSVFW